MGIYNRVRRSALTAVCAFGVAAGIGMTVAPVSALAAEKCAATTGSGSSLQGIQQTKWTTGRKLAGCTPEAPGITYTSTGSGKALKEWGMPGSVLVPAEAGGGKLDGFIGTDDPPTEAQLKEAEKASESKAETVPVVAAPVAMIIHPPANCTATGTEFKINNKVLSEMWIGKYANWKIFLEKAGVTFEEKVAKACEVVIIHEVRSDGSGTSYAFKQYLSQIEPNKAEWEKVANDNVEWPAGTKAETEHEETGKKPNKGSSGEAKAVFLTAGSVGYVNTADAIAAGFVKYAAKGTTFWAKTQDNGTEEVGAKGAEPIIGTEGNCPAKVTAATVLPKGTDNPPLWANVHLGHPNTEEAGTYSLCTFTYDVAWNKYTTTILNGATNYNGKGAEIGSTVKQYFSFMVSATEGQAKANIAADYSKLPGAVQKVAAEIVTNSVG